MVLGGHLLIVPDLFGRTCELVHTLSAPTPSHLGGRIELAEAAIEKLDAGTEVNESANRRQTVPLSPMPKAKHLNLVGWGSRYLEPFSKAI